MIPDTTGRIPSALPLHIPHGLLHHAAAMRAAVYELLGDSLPPLARLRIYHLDMLALVEYGAMLAIDLTIDIAYILPGHAVLHDPAAPPPITLDPETLRARIADLLAMHARKLN